MRDGLGAVQSVALLGGNSDIGLAIVRELATAHRLSDIALVGGNTEHLEDNRQSLRGELPQTRVRVIPADFAADPASTQAIDQIFTNHQVDVIIHAAGLLGADIDMLADLDDISRMMRVNYLSAVLTGTQAVARLREQGSGTLVVLSSVAAERPRADNFVYASTKAAIDSWANGLADKLANEPVDVIVVRPGFVESKMTSGLPAQPFATTPQDVAKTVATAIRKRTPLVWSPAVVRPLMSTLRHLPRPVFRAVAARAQDRSDR